MTEHNGSSKWMITVRVILVLLGVIQMAFMGWAKWITQEVLESKAERTAIRQDISNIKDDMSYIRTKFDSIFELRRK